MKRAASVACVVALLVSAASLVGAQGRGGGGAAPARAGGPGGAPGTVERITVHGKALEGNLEGDSPDREATVYLPPSYAAYQARRYPVVYLLHGYGGREDTFTARLANLQESGDRLAAAQGFSERIVVTPNAYSLHKGSMYLEFAHHRRLGALHRRGSRRLHGRPLPHAPRPHEPRARRPLDGRIRRAADRHEAAGRLRRAVPHELVLPDGEPESRTPRRWRRRKRSRRGSRPRKRRAPGLRARP